jgi:uncharacterized DUF497 family protein
LNTTPSKTPAISPSTASRSPTLCWCENPNKVTWPSIRPGDLEDRMMDIAMVEVAGVVLVLVYAIRGNTVRAISMRRASKTERRRYEEAR